MSQYQIDPNTGKLIASKDSKQTALKSVIIYRGEGEVTPKTPNIIVKKV